MTTISKKVTYQTEKVTRDDGSIVNVSRCALKDMPTLLEVQERLVRAYVECDGAVGAIMAEPSVQADLATICSLLPIEPRPKSGEVTYLCFDDISANWEQLIYLFFNGSIDITNRNVPSISSSRIAALHFLPYDKMIKEILAEKVESEKD